MAAIGFLGGDPAKADRVMTLTTGEVGIDIRLHHPDASALRVFSRNDQVADTILGEWVNNSAETVRTGYSNEKMEHRARPGSPSTIPMRVQQRSNLQTGDLQQWTTAGNSVLSAIGPDGHARLAVDEWVDLALTAGFSHSSVRAQVRLETAYGTARLRGAFVHDEGSGFGAGVTLATVPAGYRPETDFVQIGRADSSGITLTITATGLVSSGSSIGTGAGPTIRLDGYTWAVAP